MEYVPGGSLEARIATGPLPLDDLTRFGAAIAEALHSAHARGVLHRDLKPGNVVLTESGQPKILDFGIAALMDTDPNAAKLTQAGMILGSLPYMAPEQLADDPTDARTDIYALGVLLFEMATGRRPFIKERREALMFEIFSTAPPSLQSLRPEIPAALDQLVDACLRKEPAERPASAAQVAESLRAIGRRYQRPARYRPPPATVIRAIVVLPLRNVSGDPSQEYFADGMTDAIISDLSRIKALRVISRTSAMQYKGSTLSLPQIARELNVDAVLEGSALLVGNRVRVSVQLVGARSDQTLWADRYDRDLVDVLGLQGDLAATVAREIAVQLTPAEASHLARRAAGESGGAPRGPQEPAQPHRRHEGSPGARAASCSPRTRARSGVRAGLVRARRLPGASARRAAWRPPPKPAPRPPPPPAAPSSSTPPSPTHGPHSA